MIKSLLKVRLTQTVYSMVNAGGKKRSGGMTVLMIALMIYCFIAFSFMFGAYYFMIAQPFHEAGLDWLYFAMSAIAAFVMSFLVNVFSVHSQLFMSKDNELLLSMPIKPSSIIASRIIMIWIQHFVFCVIAMFPAAIVYAVQNGITAIMATVFILVLIMISLLSMTVSTLVGWLIGIMTRKMRAKNILTTVLSLTFLVAYFLLFSQLNSLIGSLITNMDAISQSLSGIFLIYQIGTAIADANWLGLIITAGICIIPFVAVFTLISKSFIKIVTTKVSEVGPRRKKEKLAQAGVKTALLKRELSRFTSSSVYMVNSSMGIFFSVIIAIVMVVNRDYIELFKEMFIDSPDQLAAIVCALLCFLASSDMLTAPSISLEGRNLWILKTLPVSVSDILLAKVNMQMVICTPISVVVSMFFIIFFSVPWYMAPLLIITPIVYVAFSALVGVIINLRFPNLGWTNETQAVKQGMSVFFTMIATFFSVAVPAMIYAIICLVLPIIANPFIFISIVTVIMAALDYLLLHVLKTTGVRLFNEL